MYYPFFLTYILTGLIIGITVFMWALKNGQFSDQQRARFLALEDVRQAAVATPLKTGFQLYCIFFLAIAAIVASFALLCYALFFS
jgi:cbb3-type cytochrome oxidase maturation protein